MNEKTFCKRTFVGFTGVWDASEGTVGALAPSFWCLNPTMRKNAFFLWFFFGRRLWGGALPLGSPSPEPFPIFCSTLFIVFWISSFLSASCSWCVSVPSVRFRTGTACPSAVRRWLPRWFPTYPVTDFYCVWRPFPCSAPLLLRRGGSRLFFNVHFFIHKNSAS